MFLIMIDFVCYVKEVMYFEIYIFFFFEKNYIKIGIWWFSYLGDNYLNKYFGVNLIYIRDNFKIVLIWYCMC